jgi:tripartite-type tricarboxylate transporter receptor subunit TctC
MPRFASLVAAALLGLACVPALADDVGDFYRGKQLSFIITGGVGGGYDSYGRTVARHLVRHLPGNPGLVVQNMPGADVISANHLYNVAPKNGLTVGLVLNTTPFEPFYGNGKALYDSTRFNWLGTPSKETGLLIVWHTVPVDTIEEARHRTLILAATGASSTPAFYARVLAAVLGIKIKLVEGYSGQNDAFIAMERGENEGFPSTFWSSLKSSRPSWITEHQVKLLVQFGGAPNPEIASVPFALDLIADAEDRQIMAAASAQLALGRPVLAPPGVPPDRVAALRKAMDETFRDPDFLGDCARQRLECHDPASGSELARLVAEIYALPKRVQQRLIEIYDLR